MHKFILSFCCSLVRRCITLYIVLNICVFQVLKAMTLEIQIMFLLSTLDTRVKIPPMDNYAMPDSNVLRNERQISRKGMQPHLY